MALLLNGVEAEKKMWCDTAGFAAYAFVSVTARPENCFVII
jgi:hypothetical protein